MYPIPAEIPANSIESIGNLPSMETSPNSAKGTSEPGYVNGATHGDMYMFFAAALSGWMAGCLCAAPPQGVHAMQAAMKTHFTGTRFMRSPSVSPHVATTGTESRFY